MLCMAGTAALGLPMCTTMNNITQPDQQLELLLVMHHKPRVFAAKAFLEVDIIEEGGSMGTGLAIIGHRQEGVQVAVILVKMVANQTPGREQVGG